MFEVGKEYKTKGGLEVRIYATDGKESCHPIHGAVYEDGGWLPAAWTKAGQHHLDATFDLVSPSPALPKVEVNWGDEVMDVWTDIPNNGDDDDVAVAACITKWLELNRDKLLEWAWGQEASAPISTLAIKDNDEWIENTGAGPSAHVRVDVILRDGTEIEDCDSKNLRWNFHSESSYKPYDIVKWRQAKA